MKVFAGTPPSRALRFLRVPQAMRGDCPPRLRFLRPRDTALLYGNEFLMAVMGGPSAGEVTEPRDRVKMSPVLVCYNMMQ